jgi:serine protease AprX
MARYSAFVISLMLCLAAQGQSNRYIVSFKDKNNSPYLITEPEKYLSDRAITRRIRNNVPVVTADLPVNTSYVSQVKATGASTFFTSRWMNAVLVEATPAQIGSVMSLPFVSNAEMVAPGKKLIGGRTKNVRQKNTTPASNATTAQLQMVGLDSMHTDGFLGEGILISFFDGGFPGLNAAAPFQPIFEENRVKLTQDFVANSGNVYQYDKHGTEVFSVVAGVKSAAFEGGAYRASFMLFVTEDTKSEYRVEEYNWLFAAERADSAGTDIIHSSLGYNTFDDPAMDYKVSDLNGKTAIVSKAASMALDRGIVVVVSAGNEGNNNWHYITPPADVKGILGVGAVTYAGVRVNFSSIGPTSDGRIKPDVVAVGSGTAVIGPDGAVSAASGTSLAAPLVTSLVAGLMQKYPSLLPAEIVSAVTLSASKANSPDNLLGYGIPNYVAVKNYLESNSTIGDVFIFPNPADSSLSLSFKKLPVGDVDLSFYDAQGKLLANPIRTLDWLNNPVLIPLENFAAGMYLLKVKTSTLTRTFRFVKL